jgi:hypothetical protein
MSPDTKPIGWICETCGTQFEPSAAPPGECPVCRDERQYVGWAGQRWIGMEALGRRASVHFEEEEGITTLSLRPAFAIDQRAFLIPDEGRNLMWECLSLVTSQAIAALESRGGVSCMAISHPHFYASMVEWSDALGGVPIYVHEADRDWVRRSSPRIRFWRGERLELSDDLVLVHLPGHFPGSAGLWWKSGPSPGGSLLPGDALQVDMDRRHVTFMYSYPNAIPLRPSTVRGLQRAVTSLRFDDVFGFTRGRQIIGQGKAAVEQSFARYLAAVTDVADRGACTPAGGNRLTKIRPRRAARYS